MKNAIFIELNLQYFAKDGPGGEKTEPATGKKLNDVRKEGQVAKSKEIITAVMLLSLFLLIKFYVAVMGQGIIEIFKDIYSVFNKTIETSSEGVDIITVSLMFRQVIGSIVKITIPIMLVACTISVLGNMCQQKWMVTAKPLMPKLSKISLKSGFKRMFSVKQLVELFKSIAMITVMVLVAYSSVKDNMAAIYTFYDISLNMALTLIADIIVSIGIRISLFFLIIGFVDLIYQRFKFKNDNMMTKQEVKDEFKNAEGDPQIKSQIKRKMLEVSRRRMMQQLPEADVVITNPTHFAVALKYEPNEGKAPVVIAKGADYLAFQIKDKAKEYKIEIVENKPLARILYHNVDIGMEIPPELYQAVAEILASILQANDGI